MCVFQIMEWAGPWNAGPALGSSVQCQTLWPGSALWYLPVMDSGTTSKTPVGPTAWGLMGSAFLSGVSLSTVARRILALVSSSSILTFYPLMMTETYSEVVLHPLSPPLSNPCSSTTVKQHLGSLSMLDAFSPTFLPWKNILPSTTTKFTGVP